MIGRIKRDQNNCLIPEQLAGPSDGSLMLVHHDSNCEYQLATAVDCFASLAYLGITCCCKPMYNPSTGALKVDCLCGTATNVDINTNSDSNCNVPLLVQGTKTVSGATSLTNTIEKSVVMYNDNCYICNDPVTGCPVCKPVVYIPTIKADEYIGLPLDADIQYVNSLPVTPEDTTYGINETKAVSNMKLKAFVSTYMTDNGTEFVPKTNLISTSLNVGSNTNVNITSVALDYSTVNGTISTSESTQLSGDITTKNFYFGNSSTHEYYRVGSGDGSGSGSIEVQCVANATGKLPVWDPTTEEFKYSDGNTLCTSYGRVSITSCCNTIAPGCEAAISLLSCNSCRGSYTSLIVSDQELSANMCYSSRFIVRPDCFKLNACSSNQSYGLDAAHCTAYDYLSLKIGNKGYCHTSNTDCSEMGLYNGNSCISILNCPTCEAYNCVKMSTSIEDTTNCRCCINSVLTMTLPLH